MAEPEYLDAAGAAALLGVSRQTLYAYVSRGLVVSEPPRAGSRTRARRYPTRALLALREAREDGRTPARGALRGRTPVLETSISEPNAAQGRLTYRGLDAVELSRTATLEQVAALLWTGDLGACVFAGSASAKQARGPGSVADRLLACLVSLREGSSLGLATVDPPRLRSAATIVTRLFEAVGAHGTGTLSERLARGWGRPSAGADLGAALTLCADHGLAASTFTARCVASAHAPIPNVLLAALCALEGRRHGGTAPVIDELLAEAARVGARRACRRALERDGRLPGWGGGVYTGGDPRAAEILARLDLTTRDPAAQVAAFMHDLGGGPTLELALSALARKHRLPVGSAFGTFALGRSVGWIAHAFEQAREPALIRPTARYVDRPISRDADASE